MEISDPARTPTRGELHAAKASRDGPRGFSAAAEEKHRFDRAEKWSRDSRDGLSPLYTPPLSRRKLAKADCGDTSARRRTSVHEGPTSNCTHSASPEASYEPSLSRIGTIREPPCDISKRGGVTSRTDRRQMRNRLADHPAKFNVSQSECSLANLEKILCQFDMAVEYGPCCGLTRLDRWNRAAELGLNPPADLRLAVERTGNNISIFDQRLTKFGVTNPESWR